MGGSVIPGGSLTELPEDAVQDAVLVDEGQPRKEEIAALS